MAGLGFMVIISTIILHLVKILDHVEYYLGKLATAILVMYCDAASAVTRLTRVPVPMPHRHSRFDRFPELPTEMQEMVLAAVMANAMKPRLQLHAYGAKPAFWLSNGQKSETGAEFLLELKHDNTRERALLFQVDKPHMSMDYVVSEDDLSRVDPKFLVHSWWLNKEDQELTEAARVSEMTYSIFLYATRDHPVHCPYIDDTLWAGGRRPEPGNCRGLDDGCLATCNRRVQFAPKTDIFSPHWYDGEQGLIWDPRHSPKILHIPERLCDRLPPLEDVERIAFVGPWAYEWETTYRTIVGYWPCSQPKLREIFLVCIRGVVAPIGGGALPAPFLEAGGLKLTELDAAKHRFTAEFDEENMVFDVALRLQGAYNNRYNQVMKSGSVPGRVKGTRDVPPEDYSRHRVKIKVALLGQRDTSLWRRSQETTRAWALNKLGEYGPRKEE
ncbi:hypothetical protein QBC39DRAFT_345502 [Podospora conica]|nr:hypothetical protein QBC39DRAFT_345502 [Schizothecium conicum]